MYEGLKILIYPDPRLRRPSRRVEQFSPDLKDLATKMLELMRLEKGVGLAAPQVGVNIRLFIMNATGQPEDDHVYINPVLSDGEEEESCEEGCLSIPELHADIARSKKIRMTAQDLEGKPLEETQSGFPARVWQHEVDHLDGKLIIDRMGPTAKITNRKLLRDLEDKYAAEHPQGKKGK